MKNRLVRQNLSSVAISLMLLLYPNTIYAQLGDYQLKAIAEVFDYLSITNDKDRPDRQELPLFYKPFRPIQRDDLHRKDQNSRVIVDHGHTGHWILVSDNNRNSNQLQKQRDYLAIYCNQCRTVIWRFNND